MSLDILDIHGKIRYALVERIKIECWRKMQIVCAKSNIFEIIKLSGKKYIIKNME